MKKDIDELFDEYLNEIHFHNEGPSGVRSLERLVHHLNPDYTDLEEFFSDNPGAVDAVLDWLRETIPKVSDWCGMLAMENDEDDDE